MREVRFLIKTDEELNLLNMALGVLRLRFKNAHPENAKYFIEAMEKFKKRVENAVDCYWAEGIIHDEVMYEWWDHEDGSCGEVFRPVL